MALEARPPAVTRRDYTGAVGTAEVDVTVRSYGVEVIDDPGGRHHQRRSGRER
jgi:hypothetical protein